jgi:hypothetical protein
MPFKGSANYFWTELSVKLDDRDDRFLVSQYPITLIFSPFEIIRNICCDIASITLYLHHFIRKGEAIS